MRDDGVPCGLKVRFLGGGVVFPLTYIEPSEFLNFFGFRTWVRLVMSTLQSRLIFHFDQESLVFNQ